MKFPDFSQLYVADSPMEKKIEIFSFTPSQSTFGHPVQNNLVFFTLIKKILLQNLIEMINF